MGTRVTLGGVFLAEISGDPAAGVGIFAALAAGVVSFLSPCVLPLVPGYLSAVSGVSAAELETAGWGGLLCPPPALRRQLLRDLRRRGADRDGAGLRLPGPRRAAQQDRRGLDHRHGRP